MASSCQVDGSTPMEPDSQRSNNYFLSRRRSQVLHRRNSYPKKVAIVYLNSNATEHGLVLFAKPRKPLPGRKGSTQGGEGGGGNVPGQAEGLTCLYLPDAVAGQLTRTPWPPLHCTDRCGGSDARPLQIGICAPVCLAPQHLCFPRHHIPLGV